MQSLRTTRGIEWVKHCPYRSHASGIWESMVKRCKYFMKRVVQSDQLTFEELYTVFVKIEGLLNSRPLGRQLDQPSEDPMITPGHFLIGEALSHPLGPRVFEVPDNRLDSWEKVHKIEQCWWNAWYEDHLMELQTRAKWTKQHPNVRVGELVLLMEAGQPPASWPRAKVVKTYLSKDGRVRTVQIRTGFPNVKLYDRPITKLCRLPEAVYGAKEQSEEQPTEIDDDNQSEEQPTEKDDGNQSEEQPTEKGDDNQSKEQKEQSVVRAKRGGIEMVFPQTRADGFSHTP